MNSRKKFSLPALLTLTAGLYAFCLPVFGDSAPPPAAPAGSPCAGDVQKFCANVQPGQRRIAECLNQHASDLTPECQQAAQAMKKKIQGFMEACKGDSDKFCSDVPPGQGRKLQCLKQHQSDLSAACQSAMSHGSQGSGSPASAPAPAPKSDQGSDDQGSGE